MGGLLICIDRPRFHHLCLRWSLTSSSDPLAPVGMAPKYDNKESKKQRIELIQAALGLEGWASAQHLGRWRVPLRVRGQGLSHFTLLEEDPRGCQCWFILQRFRDFFLATDF